MRRIILAAIIVMHCLCEPVHAVTQVNAAMIREAQEYGKRFYKQETSAFLLPWTAYEETSPRINSNTDRAYLYSPYLLIALHAKDIALKGSVPQLADSEKILSDYNGFLTLEIVLYGQSRDFANGIEAYLLQEKRAFRNYQAVIPVDPELVSDNQGEIYRMQFYLYFADKGINYKKPVRLVVTTADQTERNFNFNLVSMR